MWHTMQLLFHQQSTTYSVMHKEICMVFTHLSPYTVTVANSRKGV